MIRPIILAAASMLALAGCSSAPPTTQGDATACGVALALYAAANNDRSALLSVALATPACQALAADVIQAAIDKAMHAAGRAGALVPARQWQRLAVGI